MSPEGTALGVPAVGRHNSTRRAGQRRRRGSGNLPFGEVHPALGAMAHADVVAEPKVHGVGRFGVLVGQPEVFLVGGSAACQAIVPAPFKLHA